MPNMLKEIFSDEIPSYEIQISFPNKNAYDTFLRAANDAVIEGKDTEINEETKFKTKIKKANTKLQLLEY